jgi:hypothetical protein
MAPAPPHTQPAPPPKKVEPYRPEMPQIPGVGPADVASTGAGRLKTVGIASVLTVTLGVILFLVLKSHARRPVQTAPASLTVPAAPDPVPVPPAPVVGTPNGSADGRVQAATAAELSDAWSSKKFVFVKPFTRDQVNAMVIRLPNGGYWAFALQEPNGRCELEYVTDMQLLASQYQFHATHPMVVSPCSETVYDPLKVGAMGGNILVRGDIVKGNGLRPPISIDVEKNGDLIIADGIE